jgi:hypothetical protein
MSINRFRDYLYEMRGEGLELHYWAFDWDDNILHMPTSILMDQKVGDKWLPVEVSTAKFAEVRGDKENYRLRDNNPELAFSEFRDEGLRKADAFIIDTKSAIETKSFAPSWNKFITCLREGAIFAIVTARGHEPKTIRKAVEYIIDNVLTSDEQYEMYNNCLKHEYIFGLNKEYERTPKDVLSKTPLVQSYLDHCDFYGVSSNSFKNEFGQGSVQNPEQAKEMALHAFIEKCNKFGQKVGAKSVSIGFSDDDPKNVDHVRVVFKEKSALTNEYDHELKLSLVKTTDRTKQGGEMTKFKKGEENRIDVTQIPTRQTEATHSIQAPGMQSSVMSFSQYNNMSSRLFPANNQDNDPVANTHRLASDYIDKQSKEWTKDLKKNQKSSRRKLIGILHKGDQVEMAFDTKFDLNKSKDLIKK